jgi:hypothetical protein
LMARPCTRRRRPSRRREPSRSAPTRSTVLGGPDSGGRKAKHKVVETLQVAGRRPSTPGRRGGVLLADDDDLVRIATLALPEDLRLALVDLLGRYGRHHPTGTITIPPDCVQATVHYTSRTPTLGHLREAFVVSIRPPPERLSAALNRLGRLQVASEKEQRGDVAAAKRHGAGSRR